MRYSRLILAAALLSGSLAGIPPTLAGARPAAGPKSAGPPSALCLDPSPIFAGVAGIVSSGAPGPVFGLNSDVVSIVAGDEDTPVPHTFAVATEYGAGRVIALGHDGVTTNEDVGQLDNRRFLLQAFEWLDPAHRHALAVTSGHGEPLREGLSDSLRAAVAAAGWVAELLPGVLDGSRLAPYSVVVISNAAGLPPTADEMEALWSFVRDGGGLFMQGLGWSYVPYHPPGTTLDDYPMNQLGQPFGIRWIDGSIDDPTDRTECCTLFHTFYPNLVPPVDLAHALALLDSIGAAHVADLPILLESDAALRGVVARSHTLVHVAEQAYAPAAPERAALYADFRAALEHSGPWYRKQVAYDRDAWPAMTRLRERGALTLADAAELDATRRLEIEQTLALGGPAARLWREHGVLLLDNCGLDPAQIGFIQALLDSIPAGLHDLRSISVSEFLAVTTPAVSLDGTHGGVNVFGSHVGDGSENAFPSDSPPGVGDLYCLVVAHEVNHVVDAWLAKTTPAYRARRDSIIQRAGPDPMNYCRSMGNWGGFLDSPQEFFAGHAMQWFANSALMLDLGVARYQGGRPCPIDQGYLFADVFSNGEPFARFYRTDTFGQLSVTRQRVTRDGQGRITDIWYGQKHLHFGLAEDGHVVSVTQDLVGVPEPRLVAPPRLRVIPNPARGAVLVRWEGKCPARVELAVFDVAGRRLARFEGGPGWGGEWRLEPRENGNRALAPGTYLVRARGGGLELRERFTLLE